MANRHDYMMCNCTGNCWRYGSCGGGPEPIIKYYWKEKDLWMYKHYIDSRYGPEDYSMPKLVDIAEPYRYYSDNKLEKQAAD